MVRNKQVYREAFERARSGKSRSLLTRLLLPFQDQYTRQSREDGERDGLAARSDATQSEARVAEPTPVN